MFVNAEVSTPNTSFVRVEIELAVKAVLATPKSTCAVLLRRLAHAFELTR